MDKTRVLAVVAVLSVVFVTANAMAKNSSGQDKSQGKKDAKEVKMAKTEAKQYRAASKETVAEMKEVAKELKSDAKDAEKAKVSKELEQIATEQEQTSEEAADAIEAVESRNKFKRFLVGTDYRNLGQLRSSLVQNRNQIRKLTKLIGETQDLAIVAELQVQLAALTDERATIKAVIETNESGFSLLGWASKFLSGYSDAPLDDDDEDALDGEIDDALEQDGGEVDEDMEDAGSDTAATE